MFLRSLDPKVKEFVILYGGEDYVAMKEEFPLKKRQTQTKVLEKTRTVAICVAEVGISHVTAQTEHHMRRIRFARNVERGISRLIAEGLHSLLQKAKEKTRMKREKAKVKAKVRERQAKVRRAKERESSEFRSLGGVSRSGEMTFGETGNGMLGGNGTKKEVSETLKRKRKKRQHVDHL